MRFILLVLFLSLHNLVFAEVCIVKSADPLTELRQSARECMQITKSCMAEQNIKLKEKIDKWSAVNPPTLLDRKNYLSALEIQDPACFVGLSHPALMCLKFQGKNIYECGIGDYCYNSGGLIFRASAKALKSDEGFMQWEIFSGEALKGRTLSAPRFAEQFSIGRVNVNFNLGHVRVWLNRQDQGLLMDKFDVKSSVGPISRSNLCSSFFADPQSAVAVTQVDVQEIVDYQNPTTKKNQEQFSSLYFLKGEALGFKKATWDVLVALTEVETWSAMKKAVGTAGANCTQKYDDYPVNWIGCMVLKFGDTMYEAIVKAVDECKNSVSGRQASAQKAGECLGKAVAVVLATVTGTKGLASAVELTRGAKSIAGQLAGKTGQVITKCVGELCGVSAGATELGIVDGAKNIVQSLKPKSKDLIKTEVLAEFASKSPNLNASTQNKINLEKEELKLAQQVRRLNLDSIWERGFFKKKRSTEVALNDENQVAFAARLTKLLKQLDFEPKKKLTQSKSDFEKQKISELRKSKNVAEIAVGFSALGVDDVKLLNQFIKDQAWTVDSLKGVDEVLTRSIKSFNEKRRLGLSESQARTEATQEILAQMTTGKKLEDLTQTYKDKVKNACACIGICPSGGVSGIVNSAPLFRVCSTVH
jgi:hypothetical protein